MNRQEVIERLTESKNFNFFGREKLCEAIDIAIEDVGNSDKFRWHATKDEIPVMNTPVICEVYGTDVIHLKDGETIEEAAERVSKYHYTTLGFIEEDGWCGADGFPMIIAPKYWKYIEPCEAEND